MNHNGSWIMLCRAGKWFVTIPTAFVTEIQPIFLPNGIPRQIIAVTLLLFYFSRTYAIICSDEGWVKFLFMSRQLKHCLNECQNKTLLLWQQVHWHLHCIIDRSTHARTSSRVSWRCVWTQWICNIKVLNITTHYITLDAVVTQVTFQRVLSIASLSHRFPILKRRNTCFVPSNTALLAYCQCNPVIQRVF